jgi:hypothetical protein
VVPRVRLDGCDDEVLGVEAARDVAGVVEMFIWSKRANVVLERDPVNICFPARTDVDEAVAIRACRPRPDPASLRGHRAVRLQQE